MNAENNASDSTDDNDNNNEMNVDSVPDLENLIFFCTIVIFTCGFENSGSSDFYYNKIFNLCKY